MKDIKVVMTKHTNYIPNDGILCERCRYYEICPFEYTCETLKHNVRFEFGGEE